MSTGLRMPAYPAQGAAARAEWGVAVVDQLRRLSAKRLPPAPIKPLRPVPSAPVALTWSVAGLTAMLSHGFMLMRGALVLVLPQTITLASGVNLVWLQFSINPGAGVTPTLTKGTAWPSLDLGTMGYVPLAQFTVTSGVADLNYLYHPGGNISYAID